MGYVLNGCPSSVFIFSALYSVVFFLFQLSDCFLCSGTTCLTFEEDPEPYGKVRDHKITQLCKELEIEVIQAVSHTLYRPEKYEKSIERFYPTSHIIYKFYSVV